MRILREELIENLSECFSKLCDDRKTMQLISEVMHNKRNYLPASTFSIVFQQRPLTDLSDNELFWIVDALCEVSNKNYSLNIFNNFSIEKIFTGKEIQMYSSTTYVKETENVYPIVFNVMKISDDQWLSTISSKQLYNLYRNQIINYNKNTQRPLKQQTKNGYRVYKIDKNIKSVNSIKESLEKGLFIPNCLTFNINMDNPYNDYLITENELILKQGQFDLIDGFHRYSAIIDLLLENPNIDFTFGVWIMNFDENKACRYIAQEDKRNKINKSYSKSLDALNSENYSGRIIQLLNESDTILKGKLTRYNNSKINYDDVVVTIDENYKCKTRIEAKTTSDEIIKYIEYLEDDDIINNSTSNKTLIFSLIGISLLLEDKINYEILKTKIYDFLKDKITLKTTNNIKNYYIN
jgi:hypothetical protein